MLLRSLPFNTVAEGTALNIRYYTFVYVALVIQQANQTRCITFSSVACLAPEYYFKLSHKRQDLKLKKKLLKKNMFRFYVPTSPEILIIL
jgi:hypothetical protein